MLVTQSALCVRIPMTDWAPEMLKRTRNGRRMQYTNSVDWWSLGCVIYELIEGICPFRTAKAKKCVSSLDKVRGEDGKPDTTREPIRAQASTTIHR